MIKPVMIILPAIKVGQMHLNMDLKTDEMQDYSYQL